MASVNKTPKKQMKLRQKGSKYPRVKSNGLNFHVDYVTKIESVAPHYKKFQKLKPT